MPAKKKVAKKVAKKKKVAKRQFRTFEIEDSIENLPPLASAVIAVLPKIGETFAPFIARGLEAAAGGAEAGIRRSNAELLIELARECKGEDGEDKIRQAALKAVLKMLT